MRLSRGILDIASAMRDSLAGGACFNTKFSDHALEAAGLVRRNVSQHVLITRLLRDLAESNFHLPGGTSVVDIPAGRFAVHIQQSQSALSQRVVGCNGVHLDIVLQQELYVLLKGLRISRATDLPIGNQQDDLASGIRTRL